jgi:hypothetical protein
MEDQYGRYCCYLTNSSRYDLKLDQAEAIQWGAFHGDWNATWDISPPTLIKSGQRAGNDPTFATSVTPLDGNRTHVRWAVLHGADTLGFIDVYGNISATSGYWGSAGSTIKTIVYAWTEPGHDPMQIRVTIGNWDYDDPDWHWP